MSRSGYTLPVFACAAAIAALHWLRDRQTLALALVGLIELAQIAEIPIELGLEDCFAGYLSKPEAMIDDQLFPAWRSLSLRHVYPFQSDSLLSE